MSSKSYSSAQDNRLVVEGGSGTVLAPGSAVVAQGAASANASAGSSIHQTINTTGISGSEVQGLVDQILANATEQYNAVVGLGESLSQGISDQAAQLGSIVEATKTPESSTLTKLLPLAIIGVIFYFLSK
jgi:hypothetical protein